MAQTQNPAMQADKKVLQVILMNRVYLDRWRPLGSGASIGQA